jgi:hypothetical protein
MSVDVGSDSDSDSGSFYYLGAGGESKEEFIHNCKEMEEQAPVLRSLTVEGIKSGVLESCIAHFVEALTKCTGLQELRWVEVNDKNLKDSDSCRVASESLAALAACHRVLLSGGW